MKKRTEDSPKEINNISDELQKNLKVVNNFSWRLVLFTISVAFVIVLFIISYDAYVIKSNQLKVEANNINNSINDEFSVVVNSINMNGYLTIYEQYLKTSATDETPIEETVYYEDTVVTLNSMSLISEEIENVFVVSFKNNSILYSGISNIYTEDYDYKNMPWYNYNEIQKNNAYLSNEYTVEGNDSKLFGIVRPIMDSMSDEPLGVLVFSFNKDYLNKVFEESIKDNKSEAIIRINDGKILYSTLELIGMKDEKFVTNYIMDKHNIIYALDNENLNWNIVSYCGIKEILLNSASQYAIVIAIFILVYITFTMFINKLKVMKVVRSRKEIKDIIDLNKIQEQEPIEDSIEDVDIDEYVEMPIEEVIEVKKDKKEAKKK